MNNLFSSFNLYPSNSLKKKPSWRYILNAPRFAIESYKKGQYEIVNDQSVDYILLDKYYGPTVELDQNLRSLTLFAKHSRGVVRDTIKHINVSDIKMYKLVYVADAAKSMRFSAVVSTQNAFLSNLAVILGLFNGFYKNLFDKIHCSFTVLWQNKLAEVSMLDFYEFGRTATTSGGEYEIAFLEYFFDRFKFVSFTGNSSLYPANADIISVSMNADYGRGAKIELLTPNF